MGHISSFVTAVVGLDNVTQPAEVSLVIRLEQVVSGQVGRWKSPFSYLKHFSFISYQTILVLSYFLCNKIVCSEGVWFPHYHDSCSNCWPRLTTYSRKALTVSYCIYPTNPVSRHIVLMRTNVIHLCIVSQSTYFWLFSCYTKRNVNQCILNRVKVRVRVRFRVRVRIRVRGRVRERNGEMLPFKMHCFTSRSVQHEKGGEMLPFIHISFCVARQKSDYRALGHDSTD